MISPEVFNRMLDNLIEDAVQFGVYQCVPYADPKYTEYRAKRREALLRDIKRIKEDYAQSFKGLGH